MAAVGKIIKGKWRIDARLGAGATATVYAATHRNGYRVALKVLHVDLSRDQEIVARFLREGYVANTITHKGVVRVLDDDVTEDGAVFLVLELLEGESLASMLTKNGGRLPWMQVADKMVELLDVLSTAHSLGVVHRDIKPDNVFLTTEGVLKVLDFGLARFSLGDRESTRAGTILGTPDFMSPEQAAGKNEEVDARADLYAVGATAYVLMSGQALHTATTLTEHLQMTAAGDVRSLAKAAPWVPFQLVGVIDRALMRDKTARWSTAFEMQGALRAAVEEADVVLVPDAPTMLDPPLSSPPPEPRPNLLVPVEAVPSARSSPPPAMKSIPTPQPRPGLFVPSSRPASSTTSSPVSSLTSSPGSSRQSSTRPPPPMPEPVASSKPISQRPPPPPPSLAQPALPAPPLSEARESIPSAPSAVVASAKDPEEDEELIRRPDDATRLDPEPPVEEQEPRRRPLAKWTERLLEAEASETALSRGVVKSPRPNSGSLSEPKNELQKSTPVGPITRSALRKVAPPGVNALLPAPPQSIRVVTKFEVDDTMQSPQANLALPTPLGQIPVQSQMAPPQNQVAPQSQMSIPTPQSIPQAPYVPPTRPAPEASSGTARVLFYGVLLMTAIATYFVVRQVQQGRAPAPSVVPAAPASHPVAPPAKH